MRGYFGFLNLDKKCPMLFKLVNSFSPQEYYQSKPWYAAKEFLYPLQQTALSEACGVHQVRKSKIEIKPIILPPP